MKMKIDVARLMNTTPLNFNRIGKSKILKFLFLKSLFQVLSWKLMFFKNLRYGNMTVLRSLAFHMQILRNANVFEKYV